MKRENFGTDGRGNIVERITLTNSSGTKAVVSTLGATIVSFAIKDKTGTMRDVVLGYDKADSYMQNKGEYFGATVGRNANRIANAECTIDGVTYQLEANSDNNNLHSGTNGVSHRIWEISEENEADNSVALKFFSADMEQGFPGNMTITVTFTLTEDNAVRIAYQAVSDKDTIANFTNHSYFNLAGHDMGYVGSQELKIYSKAFTPLTPQLVPSGEICPVSGTPLDFTEFKEIGKEIDAGHVQMQYAGGYDHNYVLENNGSLGLMAEAVCKETGIHLYAYTDCPGVQFYTGNFIHEHEGKSGAVYHARDAFCLESNYYPNAINIPSFQAPLLKAGETYASVTVYQLKTDV